MQSWESDVETERSKAVARWFAIAIVVGLLAWQRARHHIDMPVPVLASLAGAVVLMNLAHSAYLLRARSCPPWYKYLSVGLDIVFVTAAIPYTGFSRSPLFFVYFVLLISNCIRYGLVMSLFIAAVVNVLYAGVLSFAPPAEREAAVLGGEGLKVLAFWGVALYGGGVASRIRRHLFELAAYEDTIAELRQELERRGGAPPAEGPSRG